MDSSRIKTIHLLVCSFLIQEKKNKKNPLVLIYIYSSKMRKNKTSTLSYSSSFVSRIIGDYNPHPLNGAKGMRNTMQVMRNVNENPPASRPPSPIIHPFSQDLAAHSSRQSTVGKGPLFSLQSIRPQSNREGES